MGRRYQGREVLTRSLSLHIGEVVPVTVAIARYRLLLLVQEHSLCFVVQSDHSISSQVYCIPVE